MRRGVILQRLKRFARRTNFVNANFYHIYQRLKPMTKNERIINQTGEVKAARPSRTFCLRYFLFSPSNCRLRKKHQPRMIKPRTKEIKPAIRKIPKSISFGDLFNFTANSAKTDNKSVKIVIVGKLNLPIFILSSIIAVGCILNILVTFLRM